MSEQESNFNTILGARSSEEKQLLRYVAASPISVSEEELRDVFSSAWKKIKDLLALQLLEQASPLDDIRSQIVYYRSLSETQSLSEVDQDSYNTALGRLEFYRDYPQHPDNKGLTQKNRYRITRAFYEYLIVDPHVLS